MEILEDTSPNYANRTKFNILNSDVTIAFAVNFYSTGEVLTKKICVDLKKPIIHIPILTLTPKEASELIVIELNKIKLVLPFITINIAGNGIYTLNNKFKQKEIDDYVFETLQFVTENPTFKFKINLIRSGGQTGVDEAGIKAGLKLNIKSIAKLPLGFKYRGINGLDRESTLEETKNRLSNG